MSINDDILDAIGWAEQTAALSPERSITYSLRVLTLIAVKDHNDLAERYYNEQLRKQIAQGANWDAAHEDNA